MTTKPAQRRRGADLDAALLKAAWEELAETGYARFTIEGVAARAKTSRPVLYRRWPGRHELALAAITAQFASVAIDVPDTGTVRGDLIALLSGASASRAEVVAVVGLHMGEFFAETGSSIGDLRQELLAGRRMRLDDILARAVARGEIDGARLTARVRTVAIDLLRHELLMTLKPVSQATVEAIVDEIFLPLVTPARS